MITITENGDRWEARFPYNTNDLAFVKTAKFRWEPNGKYWWTDDPSKVEVLNELIAPPVVSSDLTQKDTELIDIPVPEGIELRPYQKVGVSFVSTRPKVLIADDMGLGKTAQSISYFNVLRPKRTLILLCGGR